MKKIIQIGLCIFILLGMLTAIGIAQTSRTISGARLVYSSNEAFTNDNIQWPVGEAWGTINGSLSGSSWDYRSMLTSFGVDIAVKMNWVDPGGASHGVKIAEVAHNRFSNFKDIVVPVAGAFKRTFKNPHPAVVLNGKNWQDVTSINDPVDPTLPSDAAIYHKCTTWTGIDIERWTYSFFNDALTDVVILEWVFTNSSTEKKNDVYFGLRAQPGTDGHYNGDLWGNYIGAEYASGKDPVRLYYNIDADEKVNAPREDRGEPNNIFGNFRNPQYVGYFLIHADISTTDETSDINAPKKGGWSQREKSPDLSIDTHEGVYAFFSGPWDPVNPNLYTWPGSNGFIRTLDPASDIRDIDPILEQERCATFSFGPYQMEPGQDVRIVMGFAGGMIDIRSTIDLGWAYDWGAQGLRARRPLPNTPKYNNMLSDLGITLSGNRILNRDQKDKILDTGLDTMVVNAQKAIEVWEKGNVRKGKGSFNIKAAPPSPSVTVDALPGAVKVTWDDAAERLGSGVKGYKVYRNYLRPPSVDAPTDTTFIKVAEFSGTGTHEFIDQNVTRGQNYYYYVTAVSNDNVESSRFQNRGSTGTLEQGISPIRAPEKDWKNKIVVVPNPFHIRGANKYSGSDANRLNFLNTPAFCRIHIYTMTGDLVQTLYHNEGSGDEGWQRQDTFSTMVIVSGIYLFVVEELDGPNGNPTGETTTGKFIVVK